MIDKNKQYRTRDGREVRIYAVDGGFTAPVHGAVKFDGDWRIMSWGSDGVWHNGAFTDHDLIEVKPRIKREVWVNVYPEEIETLFYRTKEAADRGAVPKRIACVRITIDCEEGEGLT
jgi:hypothetical protein